MRNFVLLSCLCAFAVLFSCKKSENLLGKDLLADGLLLSDAVDTFKLETFCFVDDSLVSSNLATSLLGSYVDPVFGKYESQIFTEFNLSGLSPDFGTLSNLVIDSIVLGIEYKGYYGDLNAQTFEVYQMGERIHLDSTYYSFQTKTSEATNLMNPNKSTIVPKPGSPTIIGTQEIDSQLRLHLDTNFAKTLISEAISNPSTYSSNENFLNYFKGLNIRSNTPSQNSGDGAIFYFDLNDPLSKMTIYYKDNGLAKTYDFLINSGCADFNSIKITNSSKVQNVIDVPALGNEQFYAQANKTRAVIRCNSINDIPKNAIIQYAVLELPVSSYDYEAYYPSTSLTVSTRISSTDKSLYSLNVFGEYSSYTKSYKIDLRKYVQSIVQGEIENIGIYVNPTKMLSSTERIVFNGINSTNKKKPKLKIIYTTY